MGNYVKGRIEDKKDLSTLGADTLISGTVASVMTESGRVSSVSLTWSLTDLVDAAGDGPIVVGLAHSDYSDAEISAVLTSAVTWDRGNKIGEEIAGRLVRTVGVFDSTGVALSIDTLNDGRPIKTKLNWGLNTGATLKFWAFNQGDSALGTGAQLQVLGHANLWLKY